MINPNNGGANQPQGLKKGGGCGNCGNCSSCQKSSPKEASGCGGCGNCGRCNPKDRMSWSERIPTAVKLYDMSPYWGPHHGDDKLPSGVHGLC